MRTPKRQRGLGWFGFLFVFAIIALAAIVTVKCLPLYLNQMKVAKAVNSVASDPELGAMEATQIRNRLQRYWDIEDISRIAPRDIKVVRDERGRTLVYDYEARTHLFYNIYIVIQFQGETTMRNSPGG